MRIKKLLSFILIFAIFFTFSSCGDKRVEVSIKPEISTYSPLMSSVPGIPLSVELKTGTYGKNIRYHWVAEKGALFTWQHDGGKVNELGKDFKTNEQKVYWSVDINKKIKEASFKIYLYIEDVETSEVLSQANIQINQDKEGFFSVKVS